MRQNLGQHFLNDRAVIRTIAETVLAGRARTIIEIGPGHGELTDRLRERDAGCGIIGIEKDPLLAEDLRKRYGNGSNVEIVEGDVRKTLPELVRERGFRDGEYQIAGNIPYYLTGFLFRTVGDLEAKPERCVLTVQKEVALRIAAVPPRMNLLAASVGYWGTPTIAAFIGRKSFSPPPEVDSAVILVTTRPEGEREPEKSASAYYALARALFAQPRKTVLNNVRAALGDRGADKTALADLIARSGADPEARPQNLSVETIKKMRGIVYNTMDE